MKEEVQNKLKQFEREDLTWMEFDAMWQDIRRQMKADNYTPDYIYGIPRGGLPLGVTLSNNLNIPLILEDGIEYAKMGKKILVVDDISDSGETLSELKALYSTYNCLDKIKVATVLYRSGTKAIPDYFGKYLPATMDSKEYRWINFPWGEKQI